MRLVILFFLSIMPLLSWGHEYYFGFVEMEYNAASKEYEGTLILSAHDVEDWLQNKGVLIGQLEELQAGTELMEEVAEHLFSGFELSGTTGAIKNEIIGIEIFTNGMVHFYFHSDPIEEQSTLTFRFDLLMNYFPDQQNKVTYLKEGKASTLLFTKLSSTGKIDVL